MHTNPPRKLLLLVVLVALVLTCSNSRRVVAQRPEPPSPFARPVNAAVLAETAFGDKQPIVGTYYFYWCDVNTGELRQFRRQRCLDRSRRRREDFYSLVPPDLWATIEGRPLVWLYSAAFAKRQDPAALDELVHRPHVSD